MTDTLQAISRSLGLDVQALATISHNVANMNTPGFRGVRAVPEFGAQPGLRLAHDQSDGALTQTNRSLDLALRGPGFFVVERDGKLLLARSGSFRLDAQGQLTTQDGERVIGESGAITLASSDVRVEADGTLMSGTTAMGRLQIINVKEPAKLLAAGRNAYAYEGEIQPWTGKLVQGAIERANVDPADETIRLMELTRHAESVQRAISIYDSALDAGINKLGEN